MALTDAERQRRRRDKLKNLAEEAKYDPKQFIAYAVKDLYFKKQISKNLLFDIKDYALLNAKKYVVDFDKVKKIYIEKKIDLFFEEDKEA